MDPNLVISSVILCAAVAVVMATVFFAYREGKRVGEASKSERFDSLSCRFRLANSRWLVSYEETDQRGWTSERSGELQFRQYGSRVIGEGADENGGSWSIEGSADDRRLCYLYLDPDGRRDRLGAVMVEMQPSGDEMTGMRTSWSESGTGLQIQRIQLMRESD